MMVGCLNAKHFGLGSHLESFDEVLAVGGGKYEVIRVSAGVFAIVFVSGCLLLFE